jgi:uncharacterized protein YkwD
VSIGAILAGAVLASVGAMAGRLGAEPTTPFSNAAAVQPDVLAVTSTQHVATGVIVTTTVTHRTTTTAPAPTTTSTPPPTPAQQVFALVNQARAQAGCKPLTDDPRLDTAAQQHSDDMANRNYFSHTTPEGVTFDKRETAAGYPSPGGENIAQGQTTAQQVMTDWMNSAGHRANILNCSFVAIGIGVNTHRWDWTQDFGR